MKGATSTSDEDFFFKIKFLPVISPLTCRLVPVFFFFLFLHCTTFSPPFLQRHIKSTPLFLAAFAGQKEVFFCGPFQSLPVSYSTFFLCLATSRLHAEPFYHPPDKTPGSRVIWFLCRNMFMCRVKSLRCGAGSRAISRRAPAPRRRHLHPLQPQCCP